MIEPRVNRILQDPYFVRALVKLSAEAAGDGLEGDAVRLLGDALIIAARKAIMTDYGPPVVNDPRDFLPAPEHCTTVEEARWRYDSSQIERGKKPDSRRWGIGLSIKRDDELCELRDKIAGLLVRVCDRGYGDSEVTMQAVRDLAIQMYPERSKKAGGHAGDKQTTKADNNGNE